MCRELLLKLLRENTQASGFLCGFEAFYAFLFLANLLIISWDQLNYFLSTFDGEKGQLSIKNVIFDEI